MLTTSKPQAMDFDKIFQKIIWQIENLYRVDMDCVLRLLAIAKHGKTTNKKGEQLFLSNKEAEIFCLSFTLYSDLEQSFIREYRRRINSKEFDAYIKILQDSNINLNQRESARDYREELKQDIIQADNSVEKNQIEIKSKIAIAAVKVFDDRAFRAREIQSLISAVLVIDKSLQPPMIMRLLQKKCPLD